MVMERAKRESSCLVTDQSKAWKFLTGIRLSSLHPNFVAEDFYEATEASGNQGREEPEVYTVSSVMACSLCDTRFETRHQQKAHYRLDWHRFNLKRRMVGLKSVAEDQFAELADDVSSISGSGDSSSSSEDDNDGPPNSHLRGNQGMQSSPGRRKKVPSVHKYESDDDTDNDAKAEGNGRRHPRIYFENDEGNVVSIYRCIVHGKREAPTSHSELISRTLKLLMNQKWAIMMTGGGHFAAAVYDGPEVVVHKTFHRYTVRAKRGTVQSVRDSQGNAPKSAGASIRRHNEAALNQEVQDLLDGWKPHLDACARIFLRVPTYNRAMFYGGKNPALVKADPRVVTIPFATRRATFKELQRVWEMLATVECYRSVANVAAVLSSPKEKQVWSKGKKPRRQEKPSKDEELRTESLAKQLAKQSLEDEAMMKEQSQDNNSKEKSNVLVGEKDKDEEEVDVNLVEVEVVSETHHLKEYEVTGQKQRRKKKKTQSRVPQTDPEEESLTNELYTICRTGGQEKLELVLEKIQQKYSRLHHQRSPSRDHEQLSVNNETNERKSCPDGNPSNDLPTDNNLVAQTTHPDCNHSTEDALQNLDIDADPSSETSESANVGDGDQNVQPDDSVPADSPSTQSNIDRVGAGQSDASRHQDSLRPGKEFFKFLNKPLDNMGYTFLHVAAEDGQGSVLYRLMENGADPGVKNKKGKPPFGCALDKKTKDEFKRFRASHPDRYDYDRAQIPPPLTEEQEKEKATKQAERKRNARKAKRAREKDQKEAKEEQKKVEEEKKKEDEKKNWFANLSDREKRALAAEKRFAQQTASTTELQRCWCCGQSLGGKVPFTYMDFKFCSMPCLKQHKQTQKH